MKRVPVFFSGLALVGFCVSAQAQTTPPTHPKPQPAKEVPRPKGTAPKERTTVATAVPLDTAAFRRSGRPVDGIRLRVRDISKKK